MKYICIKLIEMIIFLIHLFIKNIKLNNYSIIYDKSKYKNIIKMYYYNQIESNSI